MAITTHREIHLPKGGVLELDLTQAFYEKVRAHYGMAPDEHVDDDHLRMFVFGAVKDAVDGVEKETFADV